MKRVRIVQRDERGFTLPEVMVTILMMVMVLFALYSIFDTGIRIFSFGNDKLEATENARVGLERMSREIRGAYSVDRANNNNYRFFRASDATRTNSTPVNAPPSAVPTSGQITFGNDLNGNGKVECLSATTCEYITYKLSGNTLVRNNTVTGTTSSTGDQIVVENVGGLTFTPLRTDGGAPANEAEISVIRIRLGVTIPGSPPRTQTLTTVVNLRNGAT